MAGHATSYRQHVKELAKHDVRRRRIVKSFYRPCATTFMTDMGAEVVNCET